MSVLPPWPDEGSILETLDEIDRGLISLLRGNARLPTSTLAAELGVSRGTVQNRLDRLMASGVLLGFTVRLRSDAEGRQVRAICSLEVRSADTRAVIAACRKMPDVGRIYSTNGRWDLVVEISTPDLTSLDQVLTEIRAIRAITHSETSILLSEFK